MHIKQMDWEKRKSSCLTLEGAERSGRMIHAISILTLSKSVIFPMHLKEDRTLKLFDECKTANLADRNFLTA